MNVSNFPFTFIHFDDISKCSGHPISFMCYAIFLCVYPNNHGQNAAYLSNTFSYPPYFSVVLLSHTHDWEWVVYLVSTFYTQRRRRDNSSIYSDVLYYPHFPCLCFDLDIIHSHFSETYHFPATQSLKSLSISLWWGRPRASIRVLWSFAKQKWTSNALRRANNVENPLMAHPKKKKCLKNDFLSIC